MEETMEYLDYRMSLPKLKTVAERFVHYAPSTATDLRRVNIADARERALGEAAEAEEAERAVATAREAAAGRRGENDLERQRLADVARRARAAADDAPSRGLAHKQDLVAERAERGITALDKADRAAEAELEPLVVRAMVLRSHAHLGRARALRCLRDAAFADVQLEVSAAEFAGEALKREIERKGFMFAEVG